MCYSDLVETPLGVWHTYPRSRKLRYFPSFPLKIPVLAEKAELAEFIIAEKAEFPGSWIILEYGGIFGSNTLRYIHFDPPFKFQHISCTDSHVPYVDIYLNAGPLVMTFTFYVIVMFGISSLISICFRF